VDRNPSSFVGPRHHCKRLRSAVRAVMWQDQIGWPSPPERFELYNPPSGDMIVQTVCAERSPTKSGNRLRLRTRLELASAKSPAK
jgi:hypothetical protein